MRILYLITFTLFFGFSTYAQNAKSSFKVVPLGVKGGLDESNLSAYMLAPVQSTNFVCLDAGTLYAGIEKAISHHVFNMPATAVLRTNIKAYLISHAHLDHVAGLIINSPADTNKNIYGTSFCLNNIQNHYFSWQTWANFGDKGEKPALNKYHLVAINDSAESKITGTELDVKAFTLSHSSPYESTAFLLCNNDVYVLYLGDTGADTIEHSNKLQQLWQAVAPLIQQHQLKGIFIEVSYPNEQPDKQLFGHLTPKLLMQEMEVLASYTGKAAMKNLPVIITHEKPEGNNEQRIKQQLKESNSLQLHLIFPQQGAEIVL
jgi:cAMP phosphodiesterase